MALAGELARYIGNEMIKTGGKELARAGAKSALSSLVPSVATKVGTGIATKAGTSLLNQATSLGLAKNDANKWILNTSILDTDEGVGKIKDFMNPILGGDKTPNYQRFLEQIGEGEYQMGHRPNLYVGDSETKFPLSNMEADPDYLPKIYGDNEASTVRNLLMLGNNGPDAQRSAKIIAQYQNQPDKMVKIFRQAPKDMNYGDWVGLSKEYADNHIGNSPDNRLWEREVPASEVMFAGDDINEWGYYPKQVQLDDELGTALDDVIRSGRVPSIVDNESGQDIADFLVSRGLEKTPENIAMAKAMMPKTELNMAIRASGVDNGVATRAENYLKASPSFDDDTMDLIETLRGVGANVDNNGLVSLYHRTTPENASEIYKTGKMFGKENDGGIFFSTNKGFQPGYGSAVVEARIPANKIQLDDIFDNNADVKYVVGRPNQMEDMSEYLVRDMSIPVEQIESDGVPIEVLNKVKKYFEPAGELGSDMKSVARAMRDYKDKNVMNMAENMIDEYGNGNFDWAALRKKGEKAIEKIVGKDGLNNLKTFIEPVVNNTSKRGEYEINKTVATNFLKSKDSDAVVKASRELLHPGTKIYRRGSKSGISWTTDKALANSSKYDGELLEHILTEDDRYIAPQFIDILQRTIENENQVLFKLK